MKRVILILTAVIVCSLSAWWQMMTRISPVVVIGNWALDRETLAEVKELFEVHKLMFDENAPSNSETHAVGIDMEGQGDEAFMYVIDAFPNQKLKEVSFLCGWAYWNNIDADLTEVGFSIKESGSATLGNGAKVLQKTYVKGEKHCYVQDLGNRMAQIIFRNQSK